MSPATGLAKLGSALCAGVFLGQLVYSIAKAPSRTVVNTGLRGLKRQRAIAESDLWARLEPFVRWLGVRLRGLLTEDLRVVLERKLALAGDYAGLVAEEVLALMVICGVVFAAVGFALGNASDNDLLPLLFGILGPWIPWIHITDAGRIRLTSVRRDLPYFVDLLSLSVGAGLDFPGGIRRLVEKASNPTDPIVEEFGLILQSLQLGRTRRAALSEFAERVPIDSAREFSTTIIQAEEQGNSVADALVVLSGMARLKRTIEGEQKAAKAGVQMLGPLMLMFVAIFALIVGPMLLDLQKSFGKV